ncbi:MAG: glycosyltransferase family 39 protein, partial [Deltaproteobacteria bacterium]|nr:glycosyltransferase family 39 protein [Deltaproteobacteria bacterium]
MAPVQAEPILSVAPSGVAKLPGRVIAALLAFAFVATIPFLGLSEFSTRGEAREAIVAQQMQVSGDWILPLAYNELLPSKPPLFHWLVAICSAPFGEVNEFAARLPSALCAIFVLALFLFCLRTTFDSKQATLFATVLLLSFEWARASVSARVDMVHASFLACGLLVSFIALERPRLGLWLFATVLFALAALGKGPVAIALPAAILSIWAIRTSDERCKQLLRIAACLGGALLLTLLWYGEAYVKAPQAFVERFWSENVARFAGTMSDTPHDHSALYLLTMFFLGLLPWSGYLLWLQRKNWRSTWRECRSNWPLTPPIVRFSVYAVTIVFLFYCIPSSKRGVYLLAAYPFAALIFTALLQSKISELAVRRCLCIGVLALMLFQGVIGPVFVAPRGSERPLAEVLSKERHGTQRIYSFGFEFYGAAFYSKSLFLRLEDAFAPQRRVPRAGDLIVC